VLLTSLVDVLDLGATDKGTGVVGVGWGSVCGCVFLGIELNLVLARQALPLEPCSQSFFLVISQVGSCVFVQGWTGLHPSIYASCVAVITGI
jgi:hypothetical protein